MIDSSTSVSQVLYMLAFDCPLPPILASVRIVLVSNPATYPLTALFSIVQVPAMCRFAAVTLAVPFIFCMLLVGTHVLSPTTMSKRNLASYRTW